MFLLLIFLAVLHSAFSQQFTDQQITQVRSNLAQVASQSWELGTRAEALIELDITEFAVVTGHSIPPPWPPTSQLPQSFSDVISIAQSVVSALPTNDTARSLVPNDGAAGDPPSIGVAVLLANWTQQTGQDYAQAAKDQLEYLLYDVPRTPDGAISHREDQLQLWADFIYMTPPFLAYYGALTANQSLLSEAYNQISLYRKYLSDGTGMWQHMALGSYPDQGHWTTGNGWAVAGMIRVLGTIQNSQFSEVLRSEQNDLAVWIQEILDGIYPYLDSNQALFNNYADQGSTFLDASGAALIAASTYRLSLLANIHSHLPQAERIRRSIASNHIDSQGWLNPVVNPEDFSQQGSHSPEGQAFVLLLDAAWRDWVAGGSVGANAALRLMAESSINVLIFLASAAVSFAHSA